MKIINHHNYYRQLARKEINNMGKISREQRIKLRAEMYAKGEIDLDTFVFLEEMEESPEDESIKVESVSIQSKAAPPPQQKATPSNKRKKALGLTLEEFNKLSMVEQQKLYDEFPDEVTALIKNK